MFVLVLLFSILFRQDRKLFERYIAHGLKWIWIEIKVIAVFVWAFVVLNIISYGFDIAGTAVTLFSVFFVFYLLGIDISHNRRIYRHNIIHSVLKLVLGNREGKKFEQIVYRKYMATAGILVGLCIVGILGYVFFCSHWFIHCDRKGKTFRICLCCIRLYRSCTAFGNGNLRCCRHMYPAVL